MNAFDRAGGNFAALPTNVADVMGAEGQTTTNVAASDPHFWQDATTGNWARTANELAHWTGNQADPQHYRHMLEANAIRQAINSGQLPPGR